MKSNQKNLSHVIQSYEDAIGFDDDDNMTNYERIYPTKKQIMDELEGLEKKRSKLRDIRKTEVYFQDNF